jgi:hypothetical protein
MTKPRSESLFHFTSSFDTLKSILTNGLYPRYGLEDVTWFGIVSQQIAYPRICFCDIPLSKITDHKEFYGNYGIGLSKAWGIRKKINPVIYTYPNGTASDLVNELMKQFEPSSNIEHTIEEKPLKVRLLANLCPLIKPLSGNMYVGDRLIEDKDFHQENEWRYVLLTPKIFTLEADYRKDRDQLNKSIEQNSLEFTPADIKYIFVEKDSQIPTLIKFINQHLCKYSSDELLILNSRIISMETVMSDL